MPEAKLSLTLALSPSELGSVCLLRLEKNVEELWLSIGEGENSVDCICTDDLCSLIWVVHHFHFGEVLDDHVDRTLLTVVSVYEILGDCVRCVSTEHKST